MSVQSVGYKANAVANTFRGPSGVIWDDAQIVDVLEDPSKGMYFFDDFIGGMNFGSTSGAVTFNSDNWAGYAYTGCTAVDAALEGGVMQLTSAGTQTGITFGPAYGSYRLVTTSTLAYNQKLWFEARLSISSISATAADVFVGLIDGFLSSGLPQAAWPLTAASPSLLAANMNLIGFWRKSASPTDWQFVYQLSGGTAVAVTNLTTLVTTALGAALIAGQSVKLGFLFDPNASPALITSAGTGQTVGATKKKLIRIFVNGVELPTFLTSDNLGGAAFPTGFMGPCVSMMGHTTPPTVNVDWIRCKQNGNS